MSKKVVSVREFRSKVSHYMGNLPITLTVYNRPVAKVVSISEKVVSISEKEEEKVVSNTNAVSKEATKVVSKDGSGNQSGIPTEKDEYSEMARVFRPVPKSDLKGGKIK